MKKAILCVAIIFVALLTAFELSPATRLTDEARGEELRGKGEHFVRQAED